ncbi:nitric-oxide reductase large subunit [Paenibacillus crassostreae]|uniref:Nitric oxide reductase n=1 Tax=Paenibacillus crassostreae TaxID=1763538 RepID=A0A167BIC4_9BACL|nr:cbb3-type cytochrome c oxidase subunit I [Paenibacillus crassostreae]AOZ94694.1 nitric-oxide reductase large subunit [Paenibacillus crassostreae]OAB72094.1 nitric oxide reductase [Paenibacillus crassostreae]
MNQVNKPKKTAYSFIKSICIATLILVFTVLLVGGYWIFKTEAPRPVVTDTAGEVIMTKDTIQGGQAVFQKYALMDYGTVLGNGSYMGPDYTAEALKVYTEEMQNFYAMQEGVISFAELTVDKQAVIRDKVTTELRENRYNDDTDTLVLTDAQVYGVEQVRAFYRIVFTEGDGWALPANLIQEDHMPETSRKWVAEGDQITQISDFFFWTAWLSSTERPGETFSYTNNWPYYEDAGNVMTYSSVLWSGVSITVLSLVMALVFFLFRRYHLEMKESYTADNFPRINLNAIPVTISQVKSVKFFVVVAILFFVQVMFGAFLAHYYTEPTGFFGMEWIVDLLPFSFAKGAHLQLAIFWIATAWLGVGIYITPIAGGREPKRQGLLVDILFWALVVIVFGSLIGEWLGINGYLGNLWFLLGHQGWEYLELGRFWQYLLAAGMLLWLFIIFRGIKSSLKREPDRGGLIHLVFYAAIGVPLFYFAAFLIQPGTSYTMSDYWRWWIVHLWVEGIFEVFAVVLIGFLLVQMKLVTKSSTIKALYFQIILILGAGVLGIGHHYYYNGSAEVWIAIGAVFSALEIIPLTLLILDAYQQYKMLRDGGVDFPYKSTFWFLISTALWNLVGAGVLGFLINLPAVNYFEHGQQLTPAHAHAAMMGVYGMFAIALVLYALRNVVNPKAWNDKLLKFICWTLNIGLAGMVFVTLLPIGFIQFKMAYDDGYWVSRDPLTYFGNETVQNFLLFRSVPDTIFLIGVIAFVFFCIKVFFNLRKPTHGENESLPVEDLTFDDENEVNLPSHE